MLLFFKLNSYVYFSLVLRLQTVNPGYVETELFNGAENYSEEAADSLKVFARLQSHDISNAVIYALGLPPNVRVSITLYLAIFKDEAFESKTDRSGSGVL